MEVSTQPPVNSTPMPFLANPSSSAQRSSSNKMMVHSKLSATHPTNPSLHKLNHLNSNQKHKKVSLHPALKNKHTCPANSSHPPKGKSLSSLNQHNFRSQHQSQDDDEESDHSLTREAERAALLPSYLPPNGEFESFPQIQQKTTDKLRKMGCVNLFPIQQMCFYPIYNREDIIARDLTGSGKTLAFALPVTEYLRKNNFISARKT